MTGIVCVEGLFGLMYLERRQDVERFKALSLTRSQWRKASVYQLSSSRG
jgi:hypothetical protein